MLRKFLLRYSPLLLLPACIIFCAVCYSKDETSDTQAKLDAVRSEILKLTNAIKQEQNSKNKLIQQLGDLEKNLAKVHSGIRNTRKKIKHYNQQLASLNQNKTKLTDSVQLQKTQLSRQIRSAYQIGNQEKIKLLLNQTNPDTFSRIMVYYGYFNRARTTLIDTIENDLVEIDALSKQINTKVIEVNKLKTIKEQYVASLENDKQSRKNILSEINKRLLAQGQKMQFLKEDEKSISKLIQSLSGLLKDIPDKYSGKSFSSQRGFLDWPTMGKVDNHYGNKRGSGDLVWQGLLISAPFGQDIRAISYGRVVFADWLRGFGLIIIIDHLDDYMSLYAHNSVLYKEVGDWVATGDIIGSVGDTGGLSESALYVEIRFQGMPLNPVKWFKSKM